MNDHQTPHDTPQAGFVPPSTGRLVRAVVFDTFGTLVDWRSGIVGALRRHLPEGVAQDRLEQLADSWRRRYQPAMDMIRSGRRGYVTLDVLHRENLQGALSEAGPGGSALDPDVLGPDVLDHLVQAWHRLPAWPDSRPGLEQLRRTHVLAPLSNAHTALLLDLSRGAGFTWDTLIGSDIAATYKPDPRAYLTAPALLGLDPGQVMLVAAHNDDLDGARRAGLATAFLRRPTEHGPAQTQDLAPTQDWDLLVTSVQEVARSLQGHDTHT